MGSSGCLGSLNTHPWHAGELSHLHMALPVPPLPASMWLQWGSSCPGNIILPVRETAWPWTPRKCLGFHSLTRGSSPLPWAVLPPAIFYISPVKGRAEEMVSCNQIYFQFQCDSSGLTAPKSSISVNFIHFFDWVTLRVLYTSKSIFLLQD